MRKITAFLALLLSGALLGGAAFAGGHGGYGGHGGHGYYGHGYYPRYSVSLGFGYYGGWGWPYYGYGYGYGPYYPYYPYYGSTVVVPAQPQTYIQQESAPPAPAQPSYWYYCADSRQYYPYVKECPGGWQKVSPQPPG